VARNGESELTTVSLSEQQVRDLVERMLKTSKRRLDLSSPFVDAVHLFWMGSEPRPLDWLHAYSATHPRRDLRSHLQ
jgi:hypothetical protein